MHSPTTLSIAWPAIKNGRSFLLALLALLALTGCYASKEPVLDKGQYVKFSGRYVCRDQITGRSHNTVFAERKDGFFAPSYMYDVDGDELRFSELANGLSLVQIRQKDGGNFILAFMRPVGTDVIFMVPNLMSKSASVEALLRAHTLKAQRIGSGDQILLTGETSDKLAFFKKHTPDMLMEMIACSPA